MSGPTVNMSLLQFSVNEWILTGIRDDESAFVSPLYIKAFSAKGSNVPGRTLDSRIQSA